MPIYEYECGACGHTLDALQKISDSPFRKCPDCGRMKLKRLISAPKFRLKGEGWYETDFKKENQRNLADGGEAKAESKEGGDMKTADGKAEKGAPETKADKKAETKKSTEKPAKKKSPGDGKAA
ncbi:MAG: FmdB family zinc ribbon protein [Pseudomonadota bacterium]